MAELFGISKGVICQQVNCRGAYEAGLSGIIAKKFPQVQESYKEFCSKYSSPDDLLGEYSICTLDADGRTFLGVANLFTQRNCGNAAHTGKKYTNTPLLIKSIKELCEKYPSINFYLPHHVDSYGRHSGIGCGFAGEKWEILYPQLKNLNLSNLYLIDTFTNETEKV